MWFSGYIYIDCVRVVVCFQLLSWPWESSLVGEEGEDVMLFGTVCSLAP